MRYESSSRGERITYEVREGVLHASSEGVEMSVDLRKRPVAQKRRRVYSRWFRVGVIGFFFSTLTLTLIAMKEGRFDLADSGPAGLLHCAFIVAGLLMIILFRRPMVATEVIRGSDGIAIWQDPNEDGSEAYRAFIERVTEEIQKTAELGSGSD